MYTSLSIKNFRGFQTLEIEGLKRVNLFTGRNNSGKTSILEALFFLWGSNDVRRVLRIYESRMLGANHRERFSQRTMPWATLFYELEVEADVEIAGTNENGVRNTLEISTTLTEMDRAASKDIPLDVTDILVTRKLNLAPRPRDFFFVAGSEPNYLLRALKDDPPFLFAGVKPDPHELAHHYNSLEVEKEEQPIIEALKLLDARISDLRTNVSDGPGVLYVDLGGRRLLPLAVLGDGAGRLFQIVMEMKRGEGGIVLIDEIENGFHYSVLPKVWELIHKLAKQYNVQVFAVTHSQECANAAHEAAKAADYDYQYFRVEQVGGNGRAYTFSQCMVETALEADLEIR